MKKNISILGVTGSIGNSTLKICENFNNNIHIRGILANTNIKELLNIINKCNPEYAVLYDSQKMLEYFGKYEAKHKNTKIYSSDYGLQKICSDNNNDIIINGISGKAGLIPSFIILKNSINLALANKESVVCAGNLLIDLAKKNNTQIIPVDSEHSAIFQLLKNNKNNYLKNIYLTASGGPFLKLDKKDWHNITIADALKHPTWNMGDKITIDSATMANKGLEVIEAHYLFNIDYDKIKVLIHPQSMIHSMIEMIDSEIYAQLGPNDMSIPIQNAIFYPEIKNNMYNKLDFSKSIKLEIIPVDFEKFKMLKIAYECGKKGKLYPCYYNFINEYLVNLFLNKKINFLQIEELTEKSIDIFNNKKELSDLQLTLDNIKLIENESYKILNTILKGL